MGVVELKRFDPAAAVFVVGGVIGIGVHGGLYSRFGPLWVYPYFLGLWLALHATFFGLQMLYLQRKTFDTRREWISDMFYYTFEAAVALLLLIGYFVGYRVDGGLWGVFLFACLVLDVWVVYQARQQWMTQDAESGKFEAEKIERTCAQKCGRCAISGINTTLRVIAFLTLGLLLGGCWTQAAGYRMYPPRGIFVPLTYPTGQVQNIHVWYGQSSLYLSFSISLTLSLCFSLSLSLSLYRSAFFLLSASSQPFVCMCASPQVHRRAQCLSADVLV
jgi:hypothetical protein